MSPQICETDDTLTLQGLDGVCCWPPRPSEEVSTLRSGLEMLSSWRSWQPLPSLSMISSPPLGDVGAHLRVLIKSAEDTSLLTHRPQGDRQTGSHGAVVHKSSCWSPEAGPTQATSCPVVTSDPLQGILPSSQVQHIHFCL